MEFIEESEATRKEKLSSPEFAERAKKATCKVQETSVESSADKTDTLE